MTNKKDKAIEINKLLQDKDPVEIIKYIEKNYGADASFSTSLSAEDQAITHIISHVAPSIKIFTLDTGRLFPETYETIEETNKKYNLNITIYFPDKEKVEKMVSEKGINLFYKSVENRKLCCNVRKKQSMKRALKGAKAWISGIRKDQSITRFYNKITEWDEINEIIKFNPILNWREKDVWKFIHENKIPYNKLHDKGFPSIGCQPCTRAIQPGEDIRSGRWWWELPEHKECGLHNQIDQ